MSSARTDGEEVEERGGEVLTTTAVAPTEFVQTFGRGLAVIAASVLIVGIQIFFSAFLLSILGLRRSS